jgi:hypothetical protein
LQLIKKFTYKVSNEVSNFFLLFNYSKIKTEELQNFNSKMDRKIFILAQNKTETSYVKETLCNSAGQGFLRIFTSDNKFIKVLWIISLFIMTGLCSYLVIESIIEYASFKVNTMTNIVFEVKSMNYINFKIKY